MTSERLKHQRLVYLITYSRADESIVPSRESFACVVINAINLVTDATIVHWSVSKEEHSGEDKDRPCHYHMAIKLNKRCRWLQIRRHLQTGHNIRVNFSDKHTDYYSAYKYVSKEDPHVLESEGHPDLRDSQPPKTTAATTKKQGKRALKVTRKRKRKERLSIFEVVQIIREKKISTRTELLALAERQRKSGKLNLAEFIANRGYKVVNDALDLAVEFDEAEEAVERSQKDRIQILKEQLQENCVLGCNKQWLYAALQLLSKNGINSTFFCQAIFDALKLGRGKYRNIYIYGPANCGKTFILSPLKIIYKAFVNPASGTFAWVGAEKAEIILLNDFRWCPAIIAWSDFLQILEGDTTHLATPKNFQNKDVVFDKDTPFFATADAPITLVRGGAIDSTNTQMMAVRWRTFQFTYQVNESERKDLRPCQRCFAEFILTSQSL